MNSKLIFLLLTVGVVLSGAWFYFNQTEVPASEDTQEVEQQNDVGAVNTNAEKAKERIILSDTFFIKDGSLYQVREHNGNEEVINHPIDVESFVLLGAYAKDKNNVYLVQNSNPDQQYLYGAPFEIVKDADPLSFTSIKFENDFIMYLDKNRFFLRHYGYNSEGPEYLKLEKALNPAEVTSRNVRVGSGGPIFGDHSQTVAIGVDGIGGTYLLGMYEGIDAHTVKDKVTCHTVPADYLVLSYVYDDKSVYVNGAIADHIDGSTFEYLGRGADGNYYAKDKNHVYSGCGNIVEGENPKTFEFVPESFRG